MHGGMSLGSDEAEAVPVEAGRDRISALPNEIIHLILGLLPAPEAVRTSVLAGGWRHHWKSMRSLSFAIRSGHPVLSYDWLNRFMACLLRDLRAPLDECFIYVEDGPCDDVGGLDAYRWVRQAVSKHHARELSVDLETQFKIPSFELGGKPLVSGRLARLELCNVVLSGRVLDFSRCSVLEDLDLYKCVILTGNISSQTLKRLRMDCCDFYRDESSRTCISAPNLVTLKLEHLVGDDYSEVRNMPMLQKAVVNLECMHGYDSDGFPACHKNGECCGFCEGCIGSESHSFGCCMLLHGLSSAAHLELSVPFAKFADVKCYPTFSNLKTLLLDDRCLSADLRPLIYILQHSPVLENLTIELTGQMCENETGFEGNHIPMPAISKHLKVVKINCAKNDARVFKLSEFFSLLGIDINF